MVSTFSGCSALIIHQPDHHRDALEAQIRRIGLSVRTTSNARTLLDHEDADVIFSDADIGHDSLFRWRTEFPPVPLIALLGSEAPGRIEWALSQYATGFLSKPIGSGRVYQTLIVAHHLHAEMKRLRECVDDLAQRVRSRPLVVRATLEVMRRHDLDEVHALDCLRRAAMEERMSVESLAAMIAGQPALASRFAGTSNPGAIAAAKKRPARI